MAVMFISWTGDFQGTAIERKVKDYVYHKYKGQICSEAAVPAIYADVIRERDRLCEIAPRCKKPEIIFHKPDWVSKEYSFRLTDDNGSGNRGLLKFSFTKTLYIAKDEQLFDAVDDVTEVEGGAQ